MIEAIRKRTEVFLKVLDGLPELRYLGDPILRTPTEITSIEEGKEIADKLNKVLLAYRGIAGIGRGLAAPQIGVAKSVFVTYVNNEHQIYINPKIISHSEELNLYRELCLSSGLMSVDIARPQSVTMQWQDELGEGKQRTFEGFEARLIQHEYDHLLGIPNLDKAEPSTIEFVVNDPLKEQLRPLVRKL